MANVFILVINENIECNAVSSMVSSIVAICSSLEKCKARMEEEHKKNPHIHTEEEYDHYIAVLDGDEEDDDLEEEDEYSWYSIEERSVE